MLLDPSGRPARGGKPIYQEIASASRDDVATTWLGELRPYADEVLTGRLGGNLRAYARLLSDWQVQSTYQQRRRAITSREWHFEAGGTDKASQMAVDWLRETVAGVRWDDVVDRMHHGLFFGYTVAELMYARDGQRVMLDQILVRDQARFRFGRVGELRLVAPGSATGEAMPARKFWTFTAGARHDDDPYGVGLAHYLYWPVLFKREGMGFYLRFMERWAAPTPIGRYPPGTPLGEQRKLLDALSALVTDGAIILPEGMTVDRFEAQRVGTNSYGPFVDYLDAAIAKVVLSQTMTTDAASTGLGSTQGEVQAGVAKEVQKGDADLICGSFSRGAGSAEGPLEWLTGWNFPGASPPSVWYSFEEPDDLLATSERDQRLYAAGWQRTQQSMDEAYGEGVYVPRQAAPQLTPQVAFAEREGAREAAPYAAPLQEAADREVARWVEQARALLETSGTLAEFSERLLGLYPLLSATELAAVVGDAAAAAHLAGRYDVQEGD